MQANDTNEIAEESQSPINDIEADKSHKKKKKKKKRQDSLNQE